MKPMLLLDHPWPLTAAIDPRSEGFEVLEDFDRLFKMRQNLTPVRFIELEQYSGLWEELDRDDVGRSVGSHLARLVVPYVRWQELGDDSTASPDPEPAGPALPNVWKRALRGALGDLTDWRNPQIVVSRQRRNRWPDGPEIQIRVDGSNSLEARVLATLESYATHPFALSDFDPWDIERCHLPAGDGRLSHYPCRLPKHPQLESLPLDTLAEKLGELRQRGWRYQVDGEDKYCYIPPADWDLAAVVKAAWRECRAFPDAIAGKQGRGPLDHWNRVWVWDRSGKRHWDVQFPTRNPEENPEYCVISHTGDLLRDRQ